MSVTFKLLADAFLFFDVKRLSHSHKKREDSLETRAVLLIFFLELEIYGVAVQGYIKTAKNDGVCLELLSKNDFEAVLVTFCYYDHGAKASEEA